MAPRALRILFLCGVALATSLVGTTVTTGPADAAYPGRDGRIAFVRGHQIFTMTAGGRDVTKLTSSGKNLQPTWSPDGRRISYIHQVGASRDVWVMRADGTGKRNVTRSGDVSSAGASWSPDGRRLAFAAGGVLQRIRSTAPFGTSTVLEGYQTGGFCSDDPADQGPVPVDRYLAWSPDGTRIAIFNRSDCQLDYRVDHYFLATHESRMIFGAGADCCGYFDWTDLFWGPDSTFGYSERDLGQDGDHQNAPSRIIYPGFASRNGDTGGAPSPSGRYLALTNASSGTAKVVRADADGTGRRVLTTGYQPDWQPRP